ncbi:MAG: DinB family protein [bacterium]
MDKAAFAPVWDMIRQRHGIGIRCIEAVPADRIDETPVKGMRSTREIFVHMCSFLRSAAESVPVGKLTYDEKAVLERVRTKEQLLAYAGECWQAADAAFARTSDANLNGMVTTPWGSSMPGFVILSAVVDEYVHHRGQLYAFLRQMGLEPPEVWDFAHNAAEYAPRPRG